MDNIYTVLEKKKAKRKSFESSEEYKFFLTHRHILDKLPRFSFLYRSENNDFDVFRANIILHAYINKQTIEKEVKSLMDYHKNGIKIEPKQFSQTIKEKILDLPYLLDDKQKIYIPFFTRAINSIYVRESIKLLSYPYDSLSSSFVDSLIDPFDLYGYKLYNSNFTRLVLVKENDGKEAAYFHYDTNTIYMVNDQGRLDAKIVLFDKYLNNPSYSHMLERITPVINAYFACSRSEFIEALYKNKFISSRLLALLRKSEGNARWNSN